MVHCCVQGCKNTHHYRGRLKDSWPGPETTQSRNYSLHDLPGDDRKEIRDLWIIAINRCALPKDVAVCSDHFTEDCFDEKWEEYKRLYGPTKVKRKLKLDAVPTIFPGRLFVHEKVEMIKESWKNKALQRQIEQERLRIEREYKDRFKYTQTECTCKCRCKKRRRDFGQQVNFSFKFMEDVGVQCPGDTDATQSVKNDHTYVNLTKKDKDLLRKRKADEDDDVSHVMQGTIMRMSTQRNAATLATESDCSDAPHSSADALGSSFVEALNSIRNSISLLQSGDTDLVSMQGISSYNTVPELQEASEGISVGEGSGYESDIFSNEASDLSSGTESLNVDLSSVVADVEPTGVVHHVDGRSIHASPCIVNLSVQSGVLSSPMSATGNVYNTAEAALDFMSSTQAEQMGNSGVRDFSDNQINISTFGTAKRLRLDPNRRT